MTAIVVLGMHRSGTSAVAGMISASGAASAGQAVRNWDNARGHHEMLALVRLNESVLAHSGGHYLSPPSEVRSTAEHAAERDRLLSTLVDGRPPLLKDPRMLLVLPFWRASAIPFRTIGVVRHPLAVARSLEAWRELPIGDGVALWLAHDRALAADRAADDYPIVDFERPAAHVIDVVAAFAGGDRVKLAAAYEPSLVHHDADGDVDPEALALYRALAAIDDAVAIDPEPTPEDAVRDRDVEPRTGSLAGTSHSSFPRDAFAAALGDAVAGGAAALGNAGALGNGVALLGYNRALRGDGAVGNDRSLACDGKTVRAESQPTFPRAQFAAFVAALGSDAAGDGSDGALGHARAALAAIEDAAAALVPIVTALVRARAFALARSILDEVAPRLELGLAELLRGKVALAAGDAIAAVTHLEAACAVPEPYFQARHLLPQALRAAGRRGEARAALAQVAGEALYPHGPLSTLAEWSYLDGEREQALAELATAIAAAPPHRRGRLRTRRAEWLLAAGDHGAARAELEQAIAEDPGYSRSREVLAGLAGSR